MRAKTRRLLILSNTLLFSSILYSAVPNTDNPTTFLGPIAQGGFATSIADNSAVAFAAEAGIRNYRISGIVGSTDMLNNRFKFSAEYLWQKINNSFFNGNTYRWISQGALEADYQYAFEEFQFNPQFDLNGYISHGPSKTLGNATGTYVDSTNTTLNFTTMRRIAGSNGLGISPGFNITPWGGGNIGLNLNYDNVRYNTTFVSSKDAKGLGGTVKLTQTITENADIGLIAALRRPFNNYQANLSFSTPTNFGTWRFDVNGAYTIGKNTLPTTYNIGLSADCLLDQTGKTSVSQRQATQDFLSWVVKPTVNMPQVLAVPDASTQSST